MKNDMTTEQKLDLLYEMIDTVNEKTNLLQKMIANIENALLKVNTQ